jgi:hypothetical protein
MSWSDSRSERRKPIPLLTVNLPGVALPSRTPNVFYSEVSNQNPQWTVNPPSLEVGSPPKSLLTSNLSHTFPIVSAQLMR